MPLGTSDPSRGTQCQPTSSVFEVKMVPMLTKITFLASCRGISVIMHPIFSQPFHHRSESLNQIECPTPTPIPPSLPPPPPKKRLKTTSPFMIISSLPSSFMCLLDLHHWFQLRIATLFTRLATEHPADVMKQTMIVDRKHQNSRRSLQKVWQPSFNFL